MSSLRLICLLGALLALTTFVPGAGVTHAAQHAAPVTYRLPTNPRSPAFRFGLQGGFSNVGPFTVIIYVGGRVSLSKVQQNSPIHLVNPRATIYPIALTGLLKLAKAEGFFSMPKKIVPKHLVSDMGTAFISIYTTAGVKTVSVVGNDSTPFYELYALLNYVAGATS
jgi:hypothetical protein